MTSPRRSRYPRRTVRRAVYAIAGIVVVMIVGVAGFHLIEGMNYVDAFYFESMLATGQGPPFVLNTDAGKLFASVMAFVSVGSVITTLIFTLGPIARDLWREGLERAEEGARTLEADLAGEAHRLRGKEEGRDKDENRTE